MSFQVLEDLCIGCGACDYACPTGALFKTDTFLGLFEIDPYRCDDCADCVPKCPEDAIVTDPTWAVCHGRGCALSSDRLALVECNIFSGSCATCGGPMWRSGNSEWSCPRCDDGRKVGCPKVHKLGHVPIPDPLTAVE